MSNSGEDETLSESQDLALCIGVPAIFTTLWAFCVWKRRRAHRFFTPNPNLGVSNDPKLTEEQKLNRKEYVLRKIVNNKVTVSNLRLSTISVDDKDAADKPSPTPTRSSRKFFSRSVTRMPASLKLEPSCYICLCDYEVGEDVSWSHNPACMHAFHQECVVEWLIKSDECPCCRNKFIVTNKEIQENKRDEAIASDNHEIFIDVEQGAGGNDHLMLDSTAQTQDEDSLGLVSVLPPNSSDDANNEDNDNNNNMENVEVVVEEVVEEVVEGNVHLQLNSTAHTQDEDSLEPVSDMPPNSSVDVNNEDNDNMEIVEEVLEGNVHLQLNSTAQTQDEESLELVSDLPPNSSDDANNEGNDNDDNMEN